MEEYLCLIDNIVYRNNLSKFRLSYHNLAIERERYKTGKDRLQAKDRICKYCSLNEIEDEFHLIVRCHLYSDLRNDLFKSINSIHRGFIDINDSNKFLAIMSSLDKNVIYKLGEYITKCFEIRKLNII